jgi:hypothetical protein
LLCRASVVDQLKGGCHFIFEQDFRRPFRRDFFFGRGRVGGKNKRKLHPIAACTPHVVRCEDIEVYVGIDRFDEIPLAFSSFISLVLG